MSLFPKQPVSLTWIMVWPFVRLNRHSGNHTLEYNWRKYNNSCVLLVFRHW